MNNFTGLIPLPFEKKYLENGPVRQKMGRILLYVIQRYSAERARNYPEYAGAHAIEVTEPLIAQPHANGTLLVAVLGEAAVQEDTTLSVHKTPSRRPAVSTPRI